MPLPDSLAIIGMALGCALVIGALGLLALRVLRKRQLIAQLVVVVLAPVLSLASGVLAVAWAMYISPHDLVVVVVVTIVAAFVSTGVALLLGGRWARAAAELRKLTHIVGDGELVTTHTQVPSSSEFDRLVAELSATSQRLAQARAEVQAIDASRRELVVWISHDLRSPLSGLRAMTEALEDGLAEDPSRFHRQMRLQVDRLTALVDNLFELSKISSGTLTLNLQNLSLHDLVSDAVAEIIAVARAKNVHLLERTSPDHTIMGDPRELSRVISNLLANALEHTPEGGEIRISTVRDIAGVTLTVHNSGTGIAPEDLHRVFEPGWRGASARPPGDMTPHTSGAGLGLAIARGIVEAHEGNIEAKNEADGCRFDVLFPLA
ncbi:HAMP domain-containing histidine kinase [Leucobacter viscericola]|uniref:Sensor-like histidine kinase SenX3 n=1 Tax=Leucobacter viscericola TaxID=2714935 RepID=A0A6G7XF75_9MICO|nr:HAMP domain-containing sensor histidine kinase [Leucobacter viscericola]QIK63162.1 HAMP domain-containing histidine kinase [Leucobacter viscericola]